jgi:hypothetical protein
MIIWYDDRESMAKGLVTPEAKALYAEIISLR